jgi:superfamily II DNA helicase RecQ
MTIVLTPTISLMNDQCAKLNERGISATFLGSSQFDKNVEDKIMEGEFKVVYVTPEKFFKENGEAKVIFSNLLENRQVGLLAIDEVHLVKILNSFR